MEDGNASDESIEMILDEGDVISRADQLRFVAALAVTQADLLAIEGHPQRSEAWLASRRGRLTGSVCGAAVGLNPHCSPDQLLKQLLWESFKGNAATRYGTEMEPHVQKMYELYREKFNPDFKAWYPNLIVSRERPWLGYSADGVVLADCGLLEFKAPYRKWLYKGMHKYYLTQIMYGMHLLGLKYCDFVVYSPKRTHIQRFLYEEGYCTKFLMPEMDRFYFERYLPLLIAQERGLLSHGDTTLPDNVVVEPLTADEATAHLRRPDQALPQDRLPEDRFSDTCFIAQKPLKRDAVPPPELPTEHYASLQQAGFGVSL